MINDRHLITSMLKGTVFGGLSLRKLCSWWCLRATIVTCAKPMCVRACVDHTFGWSRHFFPLFYRTSVSSIYLRSINTIFLMPLCHFVQKFFLLAFHLVQYTSAYATDSFDYSIESRKLAICHSRRRRPFPLVYAYILWLAGFISCNLLPFLWINWPFNFRRRTCSELRSPFAIELFTMPKRFQLSTHIDKWKHIPVNDD